MKAASRPHWPMRGPFTAIGNGSFGMRFHFYVPKAFA
jgi:hypothetical protein